MNGKQKPKRRHHHVWQRYLKAWTTNGVIWCRQSDRIFPTGTRTIAVERDFYKLHRLSTEDIALIKMLFNKGHPLVVQLNRELLNLLTAPFDLADQMAPSKERALMERLLDDYASNVLEDYHARVEASFIPSLESALNGDASFYDDDRCISFLSYLCTQYMRTKGIKERSRARCTADGSADLSRVWNIMIHMFATNIGVDLFLNRKRRKLVLVHNQTDVPFVTGDQPAINLKANGVGAPENLAIYYPISPQLALVLGDADEASEFPAEGLTPAQASMLNQKVFKASYKQVFAQTEESLRAVTSHE
jgi:hypothetical protein